MFYGFLFPQQRCYRIEWVVSEPDDMYRVYVYHAWCIGNFWKINTRIDPPTIYPYGAVYRWCHLWNGHYFEIFIAFTLSQYTHMCHLIVVFFRNAFYRYEQQQQMNYAKSLLVENIPYYLGKVLQYRNKLFIHQLNGQKAC